MRKYMDHLLIPKSQKSWGKSCKSGGQNKKNTSGQVHLIWVRTEIRVNKSLWHSVFFLYPHEMQYYEKGHFYLMTYRWWTTLFRIE